MPDKEDTIKTANKKLSSQPTLSDKVHGRLEQYYDTHYKLLAIIPIIIGIVALLLIFVHYQQTGDFMDRGISLKGGTTLLVSINKTIDPDKLSTLLAKDFPGQEFNIRVLQSGEQSSLSIETSVPDNQTDAIIPIIEQQLGYSLTKDDYSIDTIGASLSNSFFSEMLKILLLSFLLMGIIVFITFRSPVPSFYVMVCAFFDMAITLAIVNLFGIKITTAGIAAFLMLISFSVDSDILLTARVLPKELHGQRLPGTTPYQGFISALTTDMKMTATIFAAVLIAYLMSNSPDIKQIMVIMMIATFVDVVITWLLDASLCRWYLDAMEKKKGN